MVIHKNGILNKFWYSIVELKRDLTRCQSVPILSCGTKEGHDFVTCQNVITSWSLWLTNLLYCNLKKHITFTLLITFRIVSVLIQFDVCVHFVFQYVYKAMIRITNIYFVWYGSLAGATIFFLDVKNTWTGTIVAMYALHRKLLI